MVNMVLINITLHKYYGGLKSLHIITKDIKLYTNHMNLLANDNELLKYIEI